MERRPSPFPGNPAGRCPADRRELAKPLGIERHYEADREAQVAALRVVLGLPKVLPSTADGGQP